MTQDEWDAHFDARRMHLINLRGLTPLEAWRRARKITERKHGRRPGEIRLPLVIRVVIWWLKQRTGAWRPLEVSMLVKKLVVSLLYGIGAAAPALQLALADGVVTGNEWSGIFTALVVAFWGKFSSNTTVLGPSRDGETITGPK